MNALILQVAVEDWAQANGNRYPRHLSDLNQNQRSVYDLLPNGQMLVNAYNPQLTTVKDGWGDWPGGVGYASSQGKDGTLSYTIQACGLSFYYDGLVAILYSPNWPFRTQPAQIPIPHISDPEIPTLKNALVLRAAVERWAKENRGSYPAKLHSTNALGHTVIDLFPGGTLLQNAFSGNRSEPRDGRPLASGQIGYHGIAGFPPATSYRVEAYWGEGIFWSYDSWRAAPAGS
ncbi:MAG TPA: hypothetical protein VKA63_05605 [Candidatus Krumholzibacteria bacterium]|nr:hypothetical protein [Candidatus Krumholzibacteria bacterium]